MMGRLVFTISLPPLLWLLCGWPSLNLAGNLVLLGVMIAHVYVVIWQGVIFSLLRGDQFTYGGLALGVNIFSLCVTLILTIGLFNVYGGDITEVQQIPIPVWGIIGFGLLLTVVFPLLASRSENGLSNSRERREFEDPTNVQ